MLKRRLNNHRDMTNEVLIHYVKENVRNQTVRGGWKLFVFDAARIYVALFDLVAANHGHAQALPELPGKSSLSRSRPARNDDALWDCVHVLESRQTKAAGLKPAASQ